MKRIIEFLKLEVSVLWPFIVGVLLVNFPDVIKFISGSSLNLEEVVKNGWNAGVGWACISISILWSILNVFRVRKIRIIKIDGFRGNTYPETVLPVLGQQKYNSYHIEDIEEKSDIIEAYNMVVYGFNYYAGGENDDVYHFYGVSYTPLLFLLGTLYADQKKYVYYRMRHSDGKRKRLLPSLKSVTPLEEEFKNNDSDELVVRFHTSFKPDELIDEELKNKDILTMNSQIFSTDIITNRKIMIEWGDQCINSIRECCKNKNYTKVHLLLSTSTEMTFYLGTKLCQNYDKKIIVYNYSGKTEPRYWWGICPCEKDIEKAIIYKKYKKL